MSPSPGNVPPVILTVAPVRFKLSGSTTVRVGESVTLRNCVSAIDDATEFNDGALLMGLIVTVVVCEEGAETPSCQTKLSSVRLRSEVRWIIACRRKDKRG